MPDVSTLDLFFGTSGPRDANVAIVGESWGEEEAKQCKPFVGASGKSPDVGLDKMLTWAGLERDQCFCTNVVPARPANNDMHKFFHSNWEVRNGKAGPNLRGLYPHPAVFEGLARLKAQLEAVRPKLIIGLGNYALWALTQDNFKIIDEGGYKKPSGIGSWRGSQLYTSATIDERIPFLPMYHPAAAFRQYPVKYTIQHDMGARAKRVLSDPSFSWDAPKYRFKTRPSLAEVLTTLHFLQELARSGPLDLAVDYETRRGMIACCGLAWSTLDAICIPFMQVEDPKSYWSVEDETLILTVLQELLQHPNVRIIGQNFLYDAQYMALEWQFIPRIWFDTMIGHHLLWPGTPRGLDYLSSLYCDYHCYWKDEGKEWDPSIPEDQLWTYNCKDCVATFEVARELLSLIFEEELVEQWQERYETIQMTLRMMLRGVLIDRKRRAWVAMELSQALDERARQIEKLIPEDVYPRKKGAKPWYRSPKQQMEIFYDILGLKEVKTGKGEKRHRTMNADAIHVLAQREPLLRQIFEVIEELRSLGVFYSTFTQAELDPDNRMRCSYDPSGTKTFRYSSKKNAFGRGANLENIPKGRGEEEEIPDVWEV